MEQQPAQGRPPRLMMTAYNSHATSLVRVILGGLLSTENSQRRGDESARPRDPSNSYYYSDSDLEEEFGGLVPFLIRLVRKTLTILFWTLLGSCTYAVFYKCMMPNQVASEAFVFEYVPDDSHHECLVNTNGETMLQSATAEYEFDQQSPLCSKWAPLANLDLFAKHKHWEPIHPDVMPTPKTRQRLMQSRQQYYIDLAIELPESVQNINAGMFGVVVELTSTNQTALALSRMWTRFPHESAWVSLVRKAILLPWLLLGTMDESRIIYLSPFRHFTESHKFPLQYITIKIIDRRSHETVEVTKGFVTIGDEMNFAQEFLKEWYYTCFVFGTLLFMSFDYMFWQALQYLLESISNHYFAMQEPECELDLEDDEFLDASTDEFANFDDYRPSSSEENERGATGPFEQQEEQNDDVNSTASFEANAPQSFQASTFSEPGAPLSSTAQDRFDVSSNGSWEDM